VIGRGEMDNSSHPGRRPAEGGAFVPNTEHAVHADTVRHLVVAIDTWA
jgi:hypothetical protein